MIAAAVFVFNFLVNWRLKQINLPEDAFLIARWLTTANRFMRLYVSSDHPSEVLLNIITYIVKVYVPKWFAVKKIMHPVIQRNSYFAHPENILLSIVHDDRRHIRELGWRRILNARGSAETGVRTFVLNKINMNAVQHYDMIDWQK